MSEESIVVSSQNDLTTAHPRSLDELLAIASDIDNGVIDVSFEQMTDLAELIADKVDAIKMKIDSLGLAAELEKYYKNLHADHEKVIKNRIKWLENYVSFAMTKRDFKKLPGKEFCAKLVPSHPSTIKCEPNSMLYQKFPDCIDRKYSWKIPEMKARLKADPKDPIGEFITIETKQNLNFGIKKEI